MRRGELYRLAWIAAVVAVLVGVVPRGRNPEQARVVQKVEILVDKGEKDEAIGRFVNALKVPTVADVASINHVGDEAPFQEMHRVLRADYASVFARLDVDVIDDHSLLMTWPGSDPGLDPLLLISHLDVVPALGNWTYPPFSATIKDGYVHARGALDTKFTVCAILEAVRQLLDRNVVLQRGLIIALGHDEEVGGFGARSMANLLKARGVTPYLVLDEGGMIAMERASSWVMDIAPFALVGVAEKTAMNFDVRIPGMGGHASLPPRPGLSAVSRAAAFVQKLEAEPMPTRLEAPMVGFLGAIAEGVRIRPFAWVLRHASSAIFRPVLGQLLGRAFFGAKINALVRSTTGVVGLHAGDGAQNVLPRESTVSVNVRTLPSDTREDAIAYLRKLAGAEAIIEDVSAVVYPQLTVSGAEDVPFQVVKKVIRQTLSHRASNGRHEMVDQEIAPIPVYPFLLTGMTDSRWYHDIAPGRIIRFSPFALSFDELSMIHGVDEKVATGEYIDAVRFYHDLITC